MERELKTRLAVAGVGIPLCLLAVFAGGWVFAAGLGTLAAVGMHEFLGMYRGRNVRPFRVLGPGAAALFPLLAYAGGPGLAWVAAAPFLLLVGGVATLRLSPEEGPLTAAALAGFGALYVGGLLAFSVPLREGLAAGRAEGTLLFFYPVAVTWCADTAAYGVGRRYGRRSLAPTVSPNKTVAGAAGAVAAAVAVGLLYGSGLLALTDGALAPWASALFGLLVGGAAVAGDLVESSMKRECRVKDASSLLPGHGGMLDRLDSLLWVFPVAYFFLYLYGSG